MENKSTKLKELKERLNYIKKLYNINEEGVLELDNKGRVLLCSIPLDEWHNRMWKWLADYGVNGATKQMFIDANFENENAFKYMLWVWGNCFACLYDKIVNDGNCESCPICKYEYQNDDKCLNGLYYEYVTTSRKEQTKKSNLAKKIAELDWEWKGVEMEIKNENKK